MIVGLKETMANWAWLGPDDMVVYENGDKEPLEKGHWMIDFGKYKGTRLDKLDDEWYLNFLRKGAEEEGNELLIKLLDL